MKGCFSMIKQEKTFTAMYCSEPKIGKRCKLVTSVGTILTSPVEDWFITYTGDVRIETKNTIYIGHDVDILEEDVYVG
jgi:hypothetical protein